MNTDKISLSKWYLRIGLAFVFLYASVEIYLHPQNFLKYTPPFITNLINIDAFLLIFGVVEVLVGFWLLTGWKGKYPALLTVLMMAGIVVCNMEHFQVLFRNIAIATAGLALIALEDTFQTTAAK